MYDHKGNLNCLFQDVQLTLECKVTHSAKALHRNRTHNSGYRVENVESPSLSSSELALLRETCPVIAMGNRCAGRQGARLSNLPPLPAGTAKEWGPDTRTHTRAPKGNKHLTPYQGNFNKNSLPLSHFKSSFDFHTRIKGENNLRQQGWNTTRTRWTIWYYMALITWYFTEIVIPKDIRLTPLISFHRIIQLFRLTGTQ